jgi:methionyl-tRNA synthetase
MKPTISFEDFQRLDLRVGKVIEAFVPEWSQKAIEFKVDFGEEIGQKTILAGIKEFFNPQDLTGKSYIFVANLQEKQMGKSKSSGMMLMAVDENDKPTLIEVANNIKPGTVVR